MWHGGVGTQFVFTTDIIHESTEELSGMFIQFWVHFVSLFVFLLDMF